MPLPTQTLPYGLRDVKLTPYTTGETLGTGVDLPNSQTLSFSEAEDFEELRGDDKVVALRGKGASVDWELEAGGISLEAVKVLVGGTITETGVTPNIVKRFAKKTDDGRPYFKIEGQAISDSGGDFHVVIYKARCDSELEGELADGTFWTTGASGRAIGMADNKLYDLVQNETTTAIA